MDVCLSMLKRLSVVLTVVCKAEPKLVGFIVTNDRQKMEEKKERGEGTGRNGRMLAVLLRII